jgi:hypothetical protein
MPEGWVLLLRIQEGSKCRPFTHFKKCRMLTNSWGPVDCWLVGGILHFTKSEASWARIHRRIDKNIHCQNVGGSLCVLDGLNAWTVWIFILEGLFGTVEGVNAWTECLIFIPEGLNASREVWIFILETLNKICEKDITGHYNKLNLNFITYFKLLPSYFSSLG